MKTKLTQAKYRCKKGCGCKMCKPQKGGHADRKTVRDVKLSQGHDQELKETTEERQHDADIRQCYADDCTADL